MADAQTGEFERLKEFGIKAIQITKANATRMGASLTDVGKTALAFTDKMGKEAFKIIDRNNRKQVTSTIQAIWNEKYEGAMQERSKTLSGLMNNLSDDWTQFKDRVAQKTMPLIEKRVKQFSETMKKHFTNAGGAGDGWEKMLAINISRGTEYLTGFTAQLVNEAYEQGEAFKKMTDDSAEWQETGAGHAKFLIAEYKRIKAWLINNGSAMWNSMKKGANDVLTILSAIATALRVIGSIPDIVIGKKLTDGGTDLLKPDKTGTVGGSGGIQTFDYPQTSSVTNIYTQNSRHGVDNALNSRGDMSLQVGRSTLGLA